MTNYNTFQYSAAKGALALALAPLLGIRVSKIDPSFWTFSYEDTYRIGSQEEVLFALCVHVASRASVIGHIAVEQFADPIDYVLNYGTDRMKQRLAKYGYRAENN